MPNSVCVDLGEIPKEKQTAIYTNIYLNFLYYNLKTCFIIPG